MGEQKYYGIGASHIRLKRTLYDHIFIVISRYSGIRLFFSILLCHFYVKTYTQVHSDLHTISSLQYTEISQSAEAA
jgi:hypothetical protein